MIHQTVRTMARSHNGSIIDDENLETSLQREDLPRGEAQLVVREDDMITVIQGDAEKVEQRFKEQRAADLNMSIEEYDRAIEEYPMPDPLDDEPIDE